ncbi:MAG: hypothetical protein AAYR33_01785 [Acetobacteraceae bacterium]
MQHNRGIELNINGTIVKGLRFNGGATVLHATQIRTANGAQNGLKSLGVPGYMISSNIKYDVPKLKDSPSSPVLSRRDINGPMPITPSVFRPGRVLILPRAMSFSRVRNR